MRHKSAIALFAAVLVVTACQVSNESTNQTASPIGNSGTNNVALNTSHKNSPPLTNATLDVLLSGWASSDLRASMDENDRLKDQQAENRAYTASIGQQITWNNPNRGTSGTLIPVRDGYSNSGSYCRDFQQTVTISGLQNQGSVKACQQPDGSWKIAL